MTAPGKHLEIHQGVQFKNNLARLKNPVVYEAIKVKRATFPGEGVVHGHGVASDFVEAPDAAGKLRTYWYLFRRNGQDIGLLAVSDEKFVAEEIGRLEKLFGGKS